MVDRVFPGAGVNSFLRSNGILKGFESTGEVKRIDEVATDPNGITDQILNSAGSGTTDVVPISSTGSSSNVSSSVASTPATLDLPASASTAIPSTAIPSTAIPSAVASTVASTATSTEASTPATLDLPATDPTSTSTVEGYKCPCSKSPGCPCSSARRETYASKPPKSVKEVWNRFATRDRFVSGRTPRNSIEVLDKAADAVKSTLTGADKTNATKNVVEGFCNNHWHGVATSVVVTIAIIFIVLSVMIFLLFMAIIDKIYNKAKKAKGGFNFKTGMSGGSTTSVDTLPIIRDYKLKPITVF